MATPIIQTTGSVSGPGVAGQGRKDLVAGETVTLSDTEPTNTGSTYLWTMEDRPAGSSAALSSFTSPTPSYVADVVGSYRVKCLVNGVDEATEVHAVPLPVTGSRIPSFGEKTEYDASGNIKGWHEALTDFMKQTDSLIGSSGADEKVKVSATDTTPDHLLAKLVAGAGVTITQLNNGANEDVEVGTTGLSASPHDLAGVDHNSTTLAQLNAKISNATLIDTADPRLSDARAPTAHATSHENGGLDPLNVTGLSGVLASPQTPAAHTHVEADITNLIHNDVNAIHDNAAGEIAALVEKVAPVSADVVVIEDSAAGNAKKKVQVGNLPGGGGGAATALATTGADVVVNTAAPPSAGQVLKATSAIAASWQAEAGGGGSPVGAWEYVDTINVASPATTVTFGAGGNGINQTPLDGDLDEIYFMIYRIRGVSGTDYTLLPNSIATNQVTAAAYQGPTAGNSSRSDLFIGNSVPNTKDISGTIVFHAKTGAQRYMRNVATMSLVPVSVSEIFNWQTAGAWGDTTTNITTLDIQANVANNIAAGSYFHLFKLKKTASQSIVVAKTVLSAPATTISLTGLDGDLHEEYEIVGRIKMATTLAHSISWAPNGSTSNALIRSSFDAGTPGTNIGGLMINNSAVSPPVNFSFRARMFAKRDITPRFMELTGGESWGGSPSLGLFQIMGIITDDVTNLTSLDFVNSITNGFDTGSIVEVRLSK